ncbi:uncharacterized protein LOC121829541 isoform X2 [Peromyscus maniculatus bairdii]|uniref:uncharacterized protein LOC121829541 isoform X2 n=1 Tax=Peromyscus maniculatus bairdii TaxID=230844 RepID=UPI003FD34731
MGGGKAESPRGQGSPHLGRTREPPTFPEGHRAEDAARGGWPATPGQADVQVAAPRLEAACGRWGRRGRGKGHIWSQPGTSQCGGGPAAEQEARESRHPCALGACGRRPGRQGGRPGPALSLEPWRCRLPVQMPSSHQNSTLHFEERKCHTEEVTILRWKLAALLGVEQG